MPSRTIEEQFDRVEEFAALLGAAELNAATDWDEQFLADLRSNFQRYGAHTYLSDAQLEQLERIANE
ncbi:MULTISPECIES: hypothetical protein [Pseudomonas]|uniref:hypothetical protein n=1 Tax=Pseudomonas TaxID=286 RepID=UPI0003B9CB39|nr:MULTISPECIES: hypothetical protein [Pseudomonas]AON71135.1 hypothetical protein BG483_08170 [Pseudomonas aeruginosa]EKX2953083.1 hypothetical protein [Pseudomonas aeruginosa]EKX7256517.1 hypothetical protein [Pseudomonas aeruginosa]ERY20308.1 hypothetical protein Q075_02733 [Pseudomonas aeruginosa BL21]KSN81137.1 hypothetical protein APA85_08565 [Pseudomonas aeruginosa]